MKNYLFLLAVMLLTGYRSMAQAEFSQVINTTGGYYQMYSTMLDVSVGEPVTVTLTGSGGEVTQGFLQPDYGSLAVAMLEQRRPVSIFPNPVSDKLFINDPMHLISSMILTDVSGRMIQSYDSYQPFFSVVQLSPGSYFLALTDQLGHTFQTFKIVKQ